MAGLKAITVNTAPEADPHIYAEDDAAIFESIFGGDGVYSIGQQCKATVLSNNKVRVADGVLSVGGHFARIPYGEYVDASIANGQNGVNRNDIIIAKFVTTGSGGIDSITLEVKQGVAGSTATDPELTKDNLYQSGKIREMPLYRVKIQELSIVAVEQLFSLIQSNGQLQDTVDELNSKLNARKVKQIAAHANTAFVAINLDYTEYDFYVLQCCVSGGSTILSSTIIPAIQISPGSTRIHEAVYALDTNNYRAYAYFTESQVFTRCKSSTYGTVALYGIKL